jgi:Spy/CpxP family protein refolding chaperone
LREAEFPFPGTGEEKGGERGVNMKKTVMLALFGVLAFAQGKFDDRDPRDIIEKVRLYRLIQELKLTDEQSTKLFPKLQEMRKNEHAFHTERLEIVEKLKKLLGENASDGELTKVLDEFAAAFKKRAQSQAEELQSIRGILTAAQQAKFLIFQDEFEKEVRDLIKEVREHRHPPPKP